MVLMALCLVGLLMGLAGLAFRLLLKKDVFEQVLIAVLVALLQ